MKPVAPLVTLTLLLSPGLALAEDIYIAETAQGTGDGSSASNARAVSYFNNGSNWSSATGKVSAGDVIHLVGTMSTDMSFQGSGTSGNYITVDGSGATLSASFSFSVQNLSWWKIQNCTWQDGADTVVSIVGGSHGVFTRNHADNVDGEPVVWLGQYNGAVLPDAITVSDNYLATGSTDYGNTQHDIIMSEGATHLVIEGNRLEMRAGGAGNEAHDDCIQTYEKGGTSGGPPSSWTVRYNLFVMNSVASNDRSWAMLEQLEGVNDIYGNVFLGLQGAGGANGVSAQGAGTGSTTMNFFGNTFVAKNSASNNVLNLGSLTGNLRNNLFYLQGQTALYLGTNSAAPIINRDHNLWVGDNTPSCSGHTGELCAVDPIFVSYDNNNFALGSGSPAAGAGVNLGAPYDSMLAAGSVWPGPTIVPRTGAWNMGAMGGAQPVPAAPTNLRVSGL